MARKLTIELPVMKIETSPGREFYVGLAVNDERCGPDRPPDYVVDLFEAIGQRLSVADLTTWPTASDDVDGFLRGSFDWDHLTSPLKFEPSTSTALPISLSDTEEIGLSDNSEAYDHLLWWCSSKGSGTVTQLLQIADDLGLNECEGSIWVVVKKLSLLGHLDVSQEVDGEWIWRIAPLTVVVPAPDQRAFLAGAQSGRLWKLLAGCVDATRDGTYGGPSRISLPFDRLSLLHEVIGFAPRCAVGAAARWAELLPAIPEWQANLVSDPDIAAQPHRYSFERYSGSNFEQVTEQDTLAGLYRVQRTADRSRPKVVFRTTDGRWLNGDFASLRFLSLSTNGHCPESQVFADGTVVTHILQRWPTLYERALVLASGQLPSLRSSGDNEGRYLAYRSVPIKAAEKLATKLGVKLTSDPH